MYLLFFFLLTLYAIYSFIKERDFLSIAYMFGMFLGLIDFTWSLAFSGNFFTLSIYEGDQFYEQIDAGIYGPFLWRFLMRPLLITVGFGFLYYRRLYRKELKPLLKEMKILLREED